MVQKIQQTSESLWQKKRAKSKTATPQVYVQGYLIYLEEKKGGFQDFFRKNT